MFDVHHFNRRWPVNGVAVRPFRALLYVSELSGLAVEVLAFQYVLNSRGESCLCLRLGLWTCIELPRRRYRNSANCKEEQAHDGANHRPRPPGYASAMRDGPCGRCRVKNKVCPCRSVPVSDPRGVVRIAVPARIHVDACTAMACAVATCWRTIPTCSTRDTAIEVV